MLSIDQLLDEKKQVYIRNISKPRGIIVLTLVSSNGRTQREVIPNTKHPINLMHRATPDMIANSPYLRRLLQSKVLELVDPTLAEEALTDADVVAELDASYKAIDYRSSAVASARTGKSIEEITSIFNPQSIEHNEEIRAMVDQLKKNNSDITEDATEEDANVQTRVKVALEELKPREIRAELEKCDLTVDDLKYIIDNTSAGLVNSYAKKKLSELTGKKVQDFEDDVVVTVE